MVSFRTFGHVGMLTTLFDASLLSGLDSLQWRHFFILHFVPSAFFFIGHVGMLTTFFDASLLSGLVPLEQQSSFILRFTLSTFYWPGTWPITLLQYFFSIRAGSSSIATLFYTRLRSFTILPIRHVGMLVTLIPFFLNIHTSPLLAQTPSHTHRHPLSFKPIIFLPASKYLTAIPSLSRSIIHASSLCSLLCTYQPGCLAYCHFACILAYHCTISGILALVSGFLVPFYIVIVVIWIYVHIAIENPITRQLMSYS